MTKTDVGIFKSYLFIAFVVGVTIGLLIAQVIIKVIV